MSAAQLLAFATLLTEAQQRYDIAARQLAIAYSGNRSAAQRNADRASARLCALEDAFTAIALAGWTVAA